ncbi:hypothetical protein MTO96_025299 [Rhipicephalus appendiculatus]
MDIVMFYNTSQPIWTVMSTDTSNLTCQADKMYNITYEYVVFERFYKIYENISDFYLLGRFTNWNTQPDRWPNSRRPRYDQMVLSYLGFKFEFGSDILLYYHEHCAVFKIIREKGERMWLELRAWNFTVSTINIASLVLERGAVLRSYPGCSEILAGESWSLSILYILAEDARRPKLHSKKVSRSFICSMSGVPQANGR